MFASRYCAPDLECMNSAQLNSFYDEAARKMVAELSFKIATKKFEAKTVRFPADWWEAFKNRWFTPRMLKRWPVKFSEVTLEANAYHPSVAIPDHATFVEIMMRSKERFYE